MQNSDHFERFSRLRLLLEEEGLKKLEDSCVMVLGLGGVGSSCAEALARGGVGSLILLDRDIIELSNINRQALAFSSTLGRTKVEVMDEMVKEINPYCKTFLEHVFLCRDNVAQVLSAYPQVDYVIDCIDTVTAKMEVAEWCAKQGLPLLSSMGAANKLDPRYLKFDLIEQTYNCRLSKVIRRECRRRGVDNLEVLFSSELAVEIKHESGSSKSELLGTMSYMPPIMGQMLAGKVIRRIAGLEEKALKALTHKEDANNDQTFRQSLSL